MNLLLAFLFGLALSAIAGLAYAYWQRAERERMMRSIIKGSPIPTFVISRDHTVIYWNKALEALSGVRVRDIVGSKEHGKAFYGKDGPCIADMIVDESLQPDSDWYPENIRKSALIRDAYETTKFIREMGENGLWVRITAAAIRDSRGKITGAIETLEDITDSKRSEEELIRIKKIESLGTFASGVARDFDSLLSAVLRNIFLAKISAHDENKMLEEDLAIAEKAGLQAKKLAHKLITFAKGGFTVRQVEPIVGILRELSDSMDKREDIQWRISLPPDLWPVYGDGKQLRQAFKNIIENSIEAMPDGGYIELSAENVVVGPYMPSLPRGDYVKVSIKDRGCGIDEEDMPRIFDPYFTTKRDGGRGTGLGLAVSHSILKNHDGLITVESSEQSGTTFDVYIPVKPPEVSAASPEDQETREARERNRPFSL